MEEDMRGVGLWTVWVYFLKLARHPPTKALQRLFAVRGNKWKVNIFLSKNSFGRRMGAHNWLGTPFVEVRGLGFRV